MNNVEARELQIPQQMAHYDKSLILLAEVIEDLIERLQSVLHNPEMEEDQDEKKAEIELVPLAQTLLSYDYRLRESCKRLQSIIQRLEL